MENKSKSLAFAGPLKEKVDLIKRTVCKDATDDELELFMHVCHKCGLDPFMKQIYAVKRKNKNAPDTMTIQTSIDGLRLIADRSGNYSPGREPTFCYGSSNELISATAYLKKRTADGTWHEVSATAFYQEFKPSYENRFWGQMPHLMLAKCAESAALRKAFPAEMSGIYSDDEMHQGNPPDGPITIGQKEELEAMIGADDALKNRILKQCGVARLEEISATRYSEVSGKLRFTLEKRSEPKAEVMVAS